MSILLVPFVIANNPNAAILVPWLGHALAIIGVAILCWTWRRRAWHASHFALWLPVLAVAMDPVMTFCGRKLWPDNLVGGFCGLALGLCSLSIHRRSTFWAAMTGTSLGLATLAKLPSLLLLPVVTFWLWRAPESTTKRHLAMSFATVLPVVLLTLPWFAVFYGHYQTFLPTWIRPDDALRAASAHVDREMRRPFHYYVSQWTLISPIVLVVTIGYVRRTHLIRTIKLGIPLLWVGTLVAALTVLRQLGHGMQMRYLTPAIPGLYAMLTGLFTHTDSRRSFLALVALLAMLYSVSASGFYLVQGLAFDDIVSVPELLYREWFKPPLSPAP